MEIYSIPGFSEPVSSLTHLLGAGVFAALSVLLIRRGVGSRARVVALGIFGFSSVFLLSMSGVYHLLSPGSPSREVLRRLDHAAIFTLIAGTFTPLHVILFNGWRRWAPLLFIWLGAITGTTLKSVFFDAVPEWMGIAIYTILGWVGLLSASLMHREFGARSVIMLFCGGVSYTVGAGAELLDWPMILPGVFGPHEFFHVAVLFGVSFFWTTIHRIAPGKEALYADQRRR